MSETGDKSSPTPGQRAGRPEVDRLARQRVLVNHAVSRKRQKRGANRRRVPLDDVLLLADERGEDLLALDQAMSRLAQLDQRQAQVVECRFFGGMTIAETAEALELSPATVKRDWVAARAWLHRELNPG